MVVPGFVVPGVANVVRITLIWSHAGGSHLWDSPSKGKTMTTNTAPLLTAPEGSGLVDLPAHVRETPTAACSVCGDTPIWATYEEYVEHFYAFEYEGEPGHAPDDREYFEYCRDSCLGRQA